MKILENHYKTDRAATSPFFVPKNPGESRFLGWFELGTGFDRNTFSDGYIVSLFRIQKDPRKGGRATAFAVSDLFDLQGISHEC